MFLFKNFYFIYVIDSLQIIKDKSIKVFIEITIKCIKSMI